MGNKDKRTIDIQIDLDADADVIWQALTTAKGLESWFSEKAEADEGLDAKVMVAWGDDYTGASKISAWEPGRHLQWIHFSADENASDTPMIVDFYLETTSGQGCRLRLVQSGFGAGEDWDEMYDAMNSGWSYYLQHLSFYLRHHLGKTRHMISWRKTLPGHRADAWQQLIGANAGLFDRIAGAGEAGFVTHLMGDGPLAQDMQVFLHASGRVLGGILPGLDDALMMFELEPGASDSSLGVWLSLYDCTDAAVADAKQALNELMDQALNRLTASEAQAG